MEIALDEEQKRQATMLKANHLSSTTSEFSRSIIFITRCMRYGDCWSAYLLMQHPILQQVVYGNENAVRAALKQSKIILRN
jgi:hypothetical protein